MSSRLVNPSYGWFVGFAGLMYMTVGGGAIILLVAAPLLISEFGVTATPHLTLAVAIIIMILPMVINIISVQVAARVNNVAVFTEIIGTVVFGVLLMILWGVGTKPGSGADILFSTTSVQHNATWYSIALAALVGIYTLVGFELAADLSEEAINAGHNVPRAVIWAVVGSGVLGMIALIGFTIAIPSIKAVEQPGLPLLTIGSYWLGSGLTKVFIAFVVFSMFAIVVVGAAAQARLVYSLARDNMLPWSAWFRKVNPRTQTPIAALVVFGILDIAFMIYGYLQANAFGTLVAATAIIPYIIYFLITVAYARKRAVLEHVPGQFTWAVGQAGDRARAVLDRPGDPGPGAAGAVPRLGQGHRRRRRTRGAVVLPGAAGQAQERHRRPHVDRACGQRRGTGCLSPLLGGAATAPRAWGPRRGA